MVSSALLMQEKVTSYKANKSSPKPYGSKTKIYHPSDSIFAPSLAYFPARSVKKFPATKTTDPTMTHIFKAKQASLINIKNACLRFMCWATSTPSP